MSLNIDYGNVTVETKTILDQDPCYKNGNEDEEIQWYPGKYFLNGDIKGTFRHINCVFATYKLIKVSSLMEHVHSVLHCQNCVPSKDV